MYFICLFSQYSVYDLIGRISLIYELGDPLSDSGEGGAENNAEHDDDGYADKEPDKSRSRVVAAADVAASERPYELADEAYERYAFKELDEHPASGAVGSRSHVVLRLRYRRLLRLIALNRSLRLAVPLLISLSLRTLNRLYLLSRLGLLDRLRLNLLSGSSYHSGGYRGAYARGGASLLRLSRSLRAVRRLIQSELRYGRLILSLRRHRLLCRLNRLRRTRDGLLCLRGLCLLSLLRLRSGLRLRLLSLYLTAAVDAETYVIGQLMTAVRTFHSLVPPYVCRVCLLNQILS